MVVSGFSRTWWLWLSASARNGSSGGADANPLKDAVQCRRRAAERKVADVEVAGPDVHQRPDCACTHVGRSRAALKFPDEALDWYWQELAQGLEGATVGAAVVEHAEDAGQVQPALLGRRDEPSHGCGMVMADDLSEV